MGGAVPGSVAVTAHDEIDAALIDLRHLWAHPPVLSDPELGKVEISTILVCREAARRDRLSPPTVADIATALDVAHSTASRLVERAERAGAVRRVASEHDARMTAIELTERGRRLDDTATRYRRRYLDRLLATFDDGEVGQFAALLTKFATSVRTHPPGDPR